MKEVRKNIPGNCHPSLHGVNPVKKGNCLQGGGLVNDVLPETDFAVGAEFKFEAGVAGVVKDITETVESETRTVSGS